MTGLVQAHYFPAQGPFFLDKQAVNRAPLFQKEMLASLSAIKNSGKFIEGVSDLVTMAAGAAGLGGYSFVDLLKGVSAAANSFRDNITYEAVDLVESIAGNDSLVALHKQGKGNVAALSTKSKIPLKGYFTEKEGAWDTGLVLSFLVTGGTFVGAAGAVTVFVADATKKNLGKIATVIGQVGIVSAIVSLGALIKIFYSSWTVATLKKAAAERNVSDIKQRAETAQSLVDRIATLKDDGTAKIFKEKMEADIKLINAEDAKVDSLKPVIADWITELTALEEAAYTKASAAYTEAHKADQLPAPEYPARKESEKLEELKSLATGNNLAASKKVLVERLDRLHRDHSALEAMMLRNWIKDTDSQAQMTSVVADYIVATTRLDVDAKERVASATAAISQAKWQCAGCTASLAAIILGTLASTHVVQGYVAVKVAQASLKVAAGGSAVYSAHIGDSAKQSRSDALKAAFAMVKEDDVHVKHLAEMPYAPLEAV